MILGILASGEIGFYVLKEILKSQIVKFVMTDKQSIDIITFCEEKIIPVYSGNPRNSPAKLFFKDFIIDVLVSVNYLYIIEEELIKLPKRLAFNIHGSLLPKYRGRTPHVWAIINNEKETGISAHIIDKSCDSGPVLKQEKVYIDFDDTGKTILDKYKVQYCPMILSVLSNIEKNELEFIEQDHSKATYFGKRTKDDGQINWNWQKERIRNWVRAQSFPYPGAFTVFENIRVVVDKVSFSDLGYDGELPNGIILAVKPKLIVKTPNGALQIDAIRNNEMKFIKNKILT